MKGHVSKDHVHLLISLPPQVTISRPDAVAERPNSAPSACGVPASEEAFLGTTSVGPRIFLLQFRQVTDDVIAKYIAEQNVDQDEDFKVDG